MQKLSSRLLTLFLVSWMLVACGGESANSEAETADSRPVDVSDQNDMSDGQDQHQPDGFGVNASSPAPGADHQALIRDIVMEFTDAPMHETVSSDSVYLTQGETRIDVQVEHSPGSAQVTLRPQEPLAPEMPHTVHVTDAVMSTDGETFEGTTWQFTTADNVGPTPQSIIDACMSELDIEMLAHINNARASSRSCGEDPAPAVDPLAWHCTIKAAAQRHSDDMAQLNYFSHTGSDGSSAGDRLQEAGYQWGAWAENIAAGQTSVAQVVQELLESPGHCVNIMNPVFTEMGAALAENAEADYRLYWTQNFGAPR